MNAEKHFEVNWKPKLYVDGELHMPTLHRVLLGYTQLVKSTDLIVTAVTGQDSSIFDLLDSETIVNKAEEHMIDRLNEQAEDLIDRICATYNLKKDEVMEKAL